MMSMEKKTKGEETAWIWAIEALADSKQVDTALLDESLINSPYEYGVLSTIAKERLALRGLEELLSSSTSVADATNPNSTSNCIIVDVAEPAEDVLHRLLEKIEAPSSKVIIMDSYKVDLHQFILQKKAHLPKCALQQLKDALIEGGHPSTKFLREESGLNKEHQEESARKLDQITNGVKNSTPTANSTRSVLENLDKLLQKDPSSNPSCSTRMEGRKVQFVDGGNTVNHVDDVANKPKQSTKVDDFDSVNEITSPLVPENTIGIVRDGPPDVVIVSGKRKRSEVTEEPMAMEHNSDPLHVREPLRSPHGRSLLSIQNDDLAEGTQVQDIRENRKPVDGFDDYELVSKRIKKSMNDIHTEPYPSTSISNNEEIAHEAEPSNGNDANRDKASSCHSSKEVANAALRSSLLTSQMTLSPDPQDWTDSCIKCNRGDHLLVCSASTCPIAVHESCLGFSPNVDDTGDFYCPYCSYSQAINAYREIKQKFVRAKEKVELAKNYMDKFMNMEDEAKQKQPSKLPSTKKSDQSRMAGSGNFDDEINANGGQKEQANDQVILAGMCHQETGVAYACSNTLLRGSHTSRIRETEIVSATRETQGKKINDHADGRIVESKKSMEPSSVPKDALNQRERTNNICRNTLEASELLHQPVDAPGGPSPPLSGIANLETIARCQKHAEVGTENADQQQQPVNTADESSPTVNVLANSSRVGTKTLLSSQGYADVGTTKTDLPQHQDNTLKEPCPPLDLIVDSSHIGSETGLNDGELAGFRATNVEETSDDEKGGVNFEFKRRKMPVKPPSKGRVTCRRKPTPWTSEEEEKLKEGLEIYATMDAKWKKILEFGQNIFHESRTAIDLKDKWRNMDWSKFSKAAPRPRRRRDEKEMQLLMQKGTLG